MLIEISQVSLTGDRENNEDYCLQRVTEHGTALIVADGMGGHQAGELASEWFSLALAKHLHEFTSQMNQMPEDSAKALFTTAATDLHNQILAECPTANPRTTVVFAWISDHLTLSVHVGDSRFYLINPSELLWVSRDHSVAELLRAQGEISDEEVATHPDQTKLYRSIGRDETPKPSIKSLPPLEPGQAVLLCSDGFWEHILPTEIIQLAQSEFLGTSLALLAGKAVERASGNSDNVTAMIAKCGNPGYTHQDR